MLRYSLRFSRRARAGLPPTDNGIRRRAVVADLMIFDGVCLSGISYTGRRWQDSVQQADLRPYSRGSCVLISAELKMIRALRDGQKMNAVIADAFTQATKESIL